MTFKNLLSSVLFCGTFTGIILGTFLAGVGLVTFEYYQVVLTSADVFMIHLGPVTGYFEHGPYWSVVAWYV